MSVRGKVNPVKKGTKVETLTQPRILVIDDIQDNLDLVVDTLSDEPYEVVTALSAIDALQHLRERCADVAILDVRMPDIDGYELCKELATIPVMYRPVILFLTGEAKTNENMIRGLDLGACDYLVKPVSPEQLKARVRVAVRLHQEKKEAFAGGCTITRRMSSN